MQQLLTSWQILLAISVISLSFATILQKLLMKDQKTDGVTFSIFFQILVGIIIGIFALIHGFRMPNLLSYLPNTIIMILFYGFANVFAFKALGKIDASEYTVLFTTRSLWTIVGSLIFLGERFSLIQIVGTCFLLGSIALINIRKKKFSINQGSFFALLGALLFGLAFTNDAYLVQRFDVLSYISIAFILPGVGMLFVYPKTFKKLHELVLPGILWRFISFSILYAIAAITVYSAYLYGRNAAQLSALSQSTTILTVILSIVLLKETKGLFIKLLAIALAFIGVILLG